jgi:hypothetical protein
MPVYIAKKPMKVGDAMLEPGQTVPGAAGWPRIDVWVNTGYVEPVPTMDEVKGRLRELGYDLSAGEEDKRMFRAVEPVAIGDTTFEKGEDILGVGVEVGLARGLLDAGLIEEVPDEGEEEVKAEDEAPARKTRARKTTAKSTTRKPRAKATKEG